MGNRSGASRVRGSLPLPSCTFDAYDTRNVICADASEDALRSMRDECLRLHRAFNRFSSESEISRLAAADGESFECSSELAILLQLSLSLHSESKGAFNPALGPVMDSWRFAADAFCMPDGESLRAALAASDPSRIRLDGKIAVLPRGMRLDLGGVAKGFAAEVAASMACALGAKRGFLNFGGTICVLGPKPDGDAWSFGLPDAGVPYGAGFWAVLHARAGSFATSSPAYRGVDCNGTRLHHIIDPRTGRPVSNGVAEVTVHAQGAAMADALSTTLFVMGAEEGMAFARDLGVGALMRMDGGTVVMTRDFPAVIVDESAEVEVVG